MKAEIISIGDELLIGQVVNTNASWIAEQLSLAGIDVVRITAIADRREEILATLDEASARAKVILLTGGLGPTRDDITKNTLCEYFGSGLVFHEPTFEQITRLFGDRGLPIRGVNRMQAEVPDNCTPIINQHGTAPGMWFEKDDRIYVSMPGVPYEMKAMMISHILPGLAKKQNGLHLVHRIVQTQGAGESYLSELISNWEDDLPSHIKLAYLPQPGIVRLRLSGSSPDRGALVSELEKRILQLESIIPDLIFGYGEISIEEATARVLKEKGRTLATAESCTGGYIAHLLTSIPGSSAYFTGSIVAYDNRIKTSVLGVREETLAEFGAVSEQCVKEMAMGIKHKYNTDHAIAVSGIAGPEGGTDDKPVGTTWIAIAGPGGVQARKYLFGSNRQRNIRVAAVTALNKLRLSIIK
jgi:nicotinamide-nucleotide amidase